MAPVDIFIIHGIQSDHIIKDSRLLWDDKSEIRKKQLPDSKKYDFWPAFSADKSLPPKELFEEDVEKLLCFVAENNTEADSTVFIGLDMGGIVLKQAFVAARKNERYQNILEKTCACVFFATPQQALDINSRKEVVFELMSTLWQPILKRFWVSLSELIQFLEQNTIDFLEIALHATLISVFEIENDDDGNTTPYILGVPHEILIPRKTGLATLIQFEKDDSQETKIVHAIASAAKMPSEYKKYMRVLAHLSPPASFRVHMPKSDGWITQRREYQEWARQDGNSTPILLMSGAPGMGKSIALHYVFQKLTRDCMTAAIVVYFAFDKRDCRRNSVSSMLMSIIYQILSRLPGLFLQFQKNTDLSSPSKWTEEDYWMHLRTIVYPLDNADRKLIYIIDGIDGFEATDKKLRYRFLERLLKDTFDFDIQVLCTTSSDLSIESSMEIVSSRSKKEEKEDKEFEKDGSANSSTVPFLATYSERMTILQIGDCDEYKDSLRRYVGTQLEHLFFERPKFHAVELDIRKRLCGIENFFHGQLILFQIDRAKLLYSSPSFVLEHLPVVGSSLQDTVNKIIGTPSPWVLHSLEWMLFVLHPLQPRELSVAVALLGKANTEDILNSEVDENVIPRELASDLQRELGPLVSLKNGEICISHPYYCNALGRETIPRPDKLALTHLCLMYLKNALEKISSAISDEQEGDEKMVQLVGKLRYGFLKYCVQYWHVHCRQILNKSTEHLPKSDLEAIVTILRNEAFMKLLTRLNEHYGNPRSEYWENVEMPVHYAAQLGLPQIVELLLDKERPESYETLLSTLRISCGQGYPEIVRRLISRFKNTTSIMEALMMSCKRGWDEVCAILIQALEASSPNEVYEYPPEMLCVAAMNNHESIVIRLVNAGADINKQFKGKSALHYAAIRGHQEVIQQLLEMKADINAADSSQSTALQHSLENGHAQLAKYFLDQPGLEYEDTTTLQLAVRCGDRDLVDKLLNLQKPPKERAACSIQGLALHTAIEEGYTAIARLLLEQGADINREDDRGRTPLIVALEFRREELALEMLQREEIVVKENVPYGKSALKLAVLAGYVKIVEILLDRGVDINGTDETDETMDEEDRESEMSDEDSDEYDVTGTTRDRSCPLVDAANGKSMPLVRLLLERGANVDKQAIMDPPPDVDGEPDNLWSALHCAAYAGEDQIAKLLIDHHANVNLPTQLELTPLILAVLKNHVAIVDLLLLGNKDGIKRMGSSIKIASTDIDAERKDALRQQAPKVNIDAKTASQQTAMHIAAAFNYVTCLEKLMEAKALLSEKDQNRKTPLHEAVTNGSTKAVRALLRKGVSVNDVEDQGYTALHLAVDGGRFDTVQLLLASNADPNTKMNDGETPLHLAAEKGNVQIAEALIMAGADLNAQGYNDRTALHLAAQSGSKEIAQILLIRRADMNLHDAYGNTALHEAAYYGADEIIILLLDENANINEMNVHGCTPLQRAVLNDKINTTKLLLENRADPNIADDDGEAALFAAINYCIERTAQPIVDFLLEHAASVNPTPSKRGKTPLSAAVAKGYNSIAQKLRSRGADTSFRSKYGQTLLHIAASYNQIDTIQILLDWDKSIDLNARDEQGRTPVHHAAQFCNINALRLFRNLDACQFSARDYQGRTVMHLSCENFIKTDMEQLFQNEREHENADDETALNVPDKDGWTPLHWACRRNDADIVRFLLSLSANPGRPCQRGWTPKLVSQFHGTWNILRSCFEEKKRDESNAASSDIEERIRSICACDGCEYRIRGLRYHCKICPDFNFCFKCYWTAKDTHEVDHTFERFGRGPDEGPFSKRSDWRWI